MLESDKQDFDALLEIERKKYKQREEELIEQLQEAYAAARSERSTTLTPGGIKLQDLDQQVGHVINFLTGFPMDFQSLE